MDEEIATLPKVPALPTKGRIGLTEALGVSEPFMTRKAELQPKISAAEGDVAKAQQAQQETLAKGKSEAMQRYGTETESAQKTYEGKLEAEPLPAFVPTKDSMQDIAGLFSVISVIGSIVGGSGKMAAQRSMGAMNGMMEGYRKGKADQYKQERNQFDANFKTMIQKHSEFRKEMEDAVKLAATNKEAGFQAAEMAATKAGSDIVKAQLRKGDLMGAYKLVDESQKGANEAVKLEQKARAEEEKAQQHRADMAQRERQHRETLAAKAGGGALPKDTKTRAAYEFRDLAIDNVKDILNDLKDPEIRRLIGPENKYMPDVILNLQDKYPVLAQKLARFQSKEFELGGKNLTGSEQKILEPIYGWRGLTAKALEDNLTEAVRFMNKEQARIEKDYPGLAPQPYAEPTPKAAPSSFDTERNNARAAIAAGAPEDKVRERFKQKTGQEL